MLNARAEIGDDGVKTGQVEHKACEDFAQMKWSDDQSAVAFCDGTSDPELKLSSPGLTNRSSVSLFGLMIADHASAS